MPPLLLDRTDPETLSAVVDIAAGAICRFSFACPNGQPTIVEGRQCEEMCDFCVAQAFFVVHHIVAHQKGKRDGQ